MEREGRRDEFSRVLVKVPEVSRFQQVIAWDVVWQVITVSELEASDDTYVATYCRLFFCSRVDFFGGDACTCTRFP